MRGHTRFVVLAIVLAVGLAAVPIQAAGPLDPVLCLAQTLGVPALLPTDCDGDGYDTTTDCNDANAAVYPGAPDAPDMSFVDANCDGIDGDEAQAVFVAPGGLDTNPGTKAAPMLTVGAGITKAGSFGPRKSVYVQAGTYLEHVNLVADVSIFGGYGNGWGRAITNSTAIRGGPEAILGAGTTNVKLQLLTVAGLQHASDRSTYGIRAINGASLTLEALTVSSADGSAGASMPPAPNGFPGPNGGNGGAGSCNSSSGGAPGGGAPGGGGNGGGGGYGSSNGNYGSPGNGGASGGPPGFSGDPGGAGTNGLPGADGTAGSNGSGATATAGGATITWAGQNGATGTFGIDGKGGGGGGGGGGQDCFLSCTDGRGNGGGGGGGGGMRGNPGSGGQAGGGSFALYLWNSTATITGGTLTASNGGAGGNGGVHGLGGPGGFGGAGGTVCLGEVGKGGDGGKGGKGGDAGHGGGGAGGPTIALFTGGTSSAASSGTNFATGNAGPGGSGPAGNNGAPGINDTLYP